MPNEKIQIAALNTIGSIGLALVALLGLWIVLLMFDPRKGAFQNRIVSIGAFGLWIGIASLLAWFTLDPAVRAMRLVKTPAMFVVIGVVTAGILFALRRWRKDLYGGLEIVVGFATLLVLGQEYDVAQKVTAIVGFVGAIYVIIRGISNISDHWGNKY